MIKAFDQLSEELRQKGGLSAPPIRATLMFCHEEESEHGPAKILLIRKKRGLGAGKINAPGGKVDGNETFLEAAIRETQEEVGLRVTHAQEMGRLWFFFLDGLSLEVSVFLGKSWEGEPYETPEALPFWTHPSEIDYEAMWEDDRFWLPSMLKGVNFAGAFVFDQDRMIDARISFQESIFFLKLSDFYLHAQECLLRVE